MQKMMIVGEAKSVKFGMRWRWQVVPTLWAEVEYEIVLPAQNTE